MLDQCEEQTNKCRFSRPGFSDDGDDVSRAEIVAEILEDILARFLLVAGIANVRLEILMPVQCEGLESSFVVPVGCVAFPAGFVRFP